MKKHLRTVAHVGVALMALGMMGATTVGTLTFNSDFSVGADQSISIAAFTGDMTKSAGSTVTAVTKTGGVSFAASATTDTTNATNITSGTLPPARLGGLNSITASLGADVALTGGGFVTGPTIAQGSTGTWWVVGSVTVSNTASAANFNVALHDNGSGSNISSGRCTTAAPNYSCVVTLEGFITGPTGNMAMLVQDVTAAATGKILFNATGVSKDSTISAFRIN